MRYTDFTLPPTLTQEESAFKLLVRTLSTDYIVPDSVILTVPQVLQINPCFSSKTLSEAHFIPDNLEVAICKHPRYLPPVLHSHNFFEILYIINGNVTNYIGNYPLSLSQGDICIISPHIPHAIAAFSDSCVCYNLLIRTSSFENTFIKNLPENNLLFDFFRKNLYAQSAPSYLLFPTGTDTRILSCFYDIYLEYTNRNPYSRYMLNSLVTMFFVKLLQHYGALAVLPATSIHDDSNSDISAILYYIQQHYNNITLAHLSEFFNYSERHISRVLKKYTGCSFTELTHQVRLNKAADLLLTTTLPVTDIAAQIGYNDCSFFYRLFHSAYGTTPAQYRQKKKQTS